MRPCTLTSEPGLRNLAVDESLLALDDDDDDVDKLKFPNSVRLVVLLVLGERLD